MTPLVLIPGVQGRWEWMRPAIDALSKRMPVLTFSLCGDRGSNMALDPEQGVDNFVRQVDQEMDGAGIKRAVICGVSLGGLIALRYAAERPERVSGLVLVSTPGPRWAPDRVQAFCAKYWAVSAPVFLASAIVRMFPEVVRGRRGLLRAARFALSQAGRVVRSPASPRRMRQRLVWWLGADPAADAARVTAPTLILTGEPRLDRVVPVDGTLEYARLIPGARTAVLPDTGHIGLVTRPEPFARIVEAFVKEVSR